MNGQCQLCLQQKDLQASHILPAFSGKWVKNNSLTGFFRTVGEPNHRKQDLIKVPMLCTSCEGRFSQWEAQFASKIFKPWNDSSAPEMPYGSWFKSFAVSMLWRVGIFCRDDIVTNEPTLASIFEESLDCWRKFLLGERDDTEPYEQHVFLWSPVTAARNMEIPQKFHSYTMRAFDMSHIVCDHFFYMFAHLPGMSFYSAIQPTRADSKNTKIEKEGVLSMPQDGDPLVGTWVLKRSTAISELVIAPDQHEKLSAAAMKAINAEQNDERLAKKAEAILLDYEWDKEKK
jgi:hypothetical protein